MRKLLILTRAITWFNERIGRWLLCYLALGMFALLLFEVISRYAFNSPTVWTNELTGMLFGAYVMLSGGYLLVHRGHVNVDIFYGKFPPRGRAAVDILTSVLFFCFMAVVFIEGWDMARASLARMEHSHSAWNPPLWPLRLAVPIGAGLLALQGIVKLIDDIIILIDPSRRNDDSSDRLSEYKDHA